MGTKIEYDHDGNVIDPMADYRPPFVPGEDEEEEGGVLSKRVVIRSGYGGTMTVRDLKMRYILLVDTFRQGMADYAADDGCCQERHALVNCINEWENLASEWGMEDGS